jgi:hypothetical protein
MVHYAIDINVSLAGEIMDYAPSRKAFRAV